MTVSALAAFLTALIFSLILMPAVIAITKKLKFRQTILQYVDNHALKSGTPTMGGMGFVIAAIVTAFIYMRGNFSLAVTCIAVMGGYAIIGFLDDFIKVFYKQNKGLSPIQKIVFQLVVATIVSVVAYRNPFIAGEQYVPVTFKTVNFGYFAIPFYMIIFLAGSNAVNLIDGLDGLAASVTSTYLVCFTLILTTAFGIVGVTFASESETANIIIFSCAIIGSLIGFLCYNCFPAKIFMGDTGSLALGGAVSGLAIVTGMSLTLPILGIMYVITCLSVIIQVAYFKRTKKRVFLMTPIHHHFERKGVHENRIVVCYTLITLVVGLILVLAVLLTN